MKRKILKKKYRILCKMLLGGATFFGGMFANQYAAQALPVEPVEQYRANINDIIDAGGGVMNITGTGNAFISWRDFSINPGEIVNFSGMNGMLNYVSGVNPSLIYGAINAIGVKDFYVINPSGVLFGSNSQVITNNLYVSTRSLTETQIKNYIQNGTNPLNTSIDISKINNGGLKSSDIMGAYDIADGDVMFLGKVQANSLKIEGNTIQIRNTANIRKLTSDGSIPDSADGSTTTSDKLYTWDDAPKLSGSEVTLISDNPIEVGYEVNATTLTSDIDIKNPFPFDYSKMSADELVAAVLEYYGLYVYDEDAATYTYQNNTTTIIDKENRQSYGNLNVASVNNLRQFFVDKIDSSASTNDKIIAAIALDKIIRQNISTKQIRNYPEDSHYDFPYNEENTSQYTYTSISVLSFPSATDEKFSEIASNFDQTFEALKSTYNNLISNNTYKYYVADLIGDENMPNSANYLGYNAKKLNQTTKQTIDDYRLISSVYDLNQANSSKFINWTEQKADGIKFFVPSEGQIHGNYMLANDINLNGVNFKPLGYSMDFDDFASKDDFLKFNGLNFTIKGLKTDPSVSDAQGLFSIFAGTIKNVRLSNVNIDTTGNENSAVGGLIGGISGGYSEQNDDAIELRSGLDTSIKNVSVNGYIKGRYFVGSIVGNGQYGTNKPTGKINYRSSAYTNNGYWDEEKEEYVDYYADWDDWDEETQSFKKTYPETVEFTGETYESYFVPSYPGITFDNIENFSSISTDNTGDGYAGGIAGRIAGKTNISNSMNQGTIFGENYAGGILGSVSQFNGTVELNKIANMGNITSNGYAGGILGYSYQNSVNVYNSYNTGNIGNDTTPYAGGLNGGGAIIGRIEKSFNSGTITALTNASGLGNASAVYNSYNSGVISSNEGSAYGIAGSIGYDATNVYNSGKITGATAAGIAGSLWNSKNIYNIGEITNNGKSGYTAGIAKSASGSLENVYNFGKVTSTTDYDDGSSYVYQVSGYPNYDSFETKRGSTAGIINEYKGGKADKVFNFGEVHAQNGLASGLFNQTSGTRAKLNNLYNSGNVTGLSAAGIVNLGHSQSTFDGVYNLGKITATGTNVDTKSYLVNNAYTAGDYATGIMGHISGAVTLKNTYNFGEIVSNNFASGIADTLIDMRQHQQNFENVYNFSNVNAPKGAAGILRTQNFYKPNGVQDWGSAKFKNVYNYGKISSSEGLATGIYGYAEHDSRYPNNTNVITDFSNVYNFGDIEGTSAAGIMNASSNYVTMDGVYNFGNIKATNTYAAGIAGDMTFNGGSTPPIWKNVYNMGDVEGVNFASGIVYRKYTTNSTNESHKGTKILQGAYNFGNVTTTDSNGITAGIIADVGTDQINYPVLGNVYNAKTGLTYNIAPAEVTTYEQLNSATAPEKPNISITLDAKIFDTTNQTKYTPSTTETVDAPKLNKEKIIYSIWEDQFESDIKGNKVVDSKGKELTSTVWRIYPNPNNLIDPKRQPLLTQWMHPAEVLRYSQLKEDGSVDIKTLINPTYGMHALHNTKGYATSVRYKNSGQSAEFMKNGKAYYYLFNPNFFDYDINESADNNFSVKKGDKEIAEAFLYGNQFGYNFYFKENTTAWSDSTNNSTDSSGDLVSDSPLTNPANNAVYLRIGNVDNIPDPQGETEKPIDVTPGGKPSEVEPEKDAIEIDFSILVGSGEYNKNNNNVSYTYTDSDGNHYQITNPANADLSDFTVNYEEIEVKNSEGNTSHYTTLVKINYDGTEYSVDKNNLTYNESTGNYTLTVTKETDSADYTYNITIIPGEITSTETMSVDINAGAGTIDKNENFTADGYSVNNTFIENLLKDIVEVVDNGDETTTVKFKDGVNYTSSPNSDGTTTYTVNKGGTLYTFKANTENTFTYTDNKTDPNNIVNYNVTLIPGTIKIYKEKTAQVNVKNGTIVDGTFTTNGYEVEGDNVIKNFLNNLTVVRNGQATTVNLLIGKNLTYDSSTNKYIYTSTSGNTTTTYIISVNPGKVIESNHQDVTIVVGDGKKTDGGALTLDGKDYTVAGSEKLETLLTNVLEVVENGNGGTTVKFKDGIVQGTPIVDNENKTTTYTLKKDNVNYTVVKNEDSTFTYTDNSDSDKITIYNVSVRPGDITTYVNKVATIKVVDGIIENDSLTLKKVDGKNYSISGTGATNIATLLTGVLTVDKNSDGTATEIKFNSNVVVNGKKNNGDGSFTYNVTKGGTLYKFTKNSNGTYTYIDDSNPKNILTYSITVDPGTLTYEVNVKAGNITMTDNEITSGGGYTVTSDNSNFITDLLSGKIGVVETEDGKATTLAATDPTKLTHIGNNYTYKDGANTYNFTKNGNVYSYTADNGVKYKVTVEPGTLNKTYNIGIDVSDGIFYIDEKGEGTLSLELPNGYKITKNADGSKFTDNFTVKYNDPVDQTQITGPAQTTVSVTNKTTNENYKTSDISATNGVYNSLTKNSDGTYSISAVKDNITYNINIKPGLVKSDTTIPVKISVADGKITDDVFKGNGYDVTNNNIKQLLQDKLEVVNKDGKTTVQFKDEVKNLITTNADGSYTYNDGTNTYTFSKNNDGSYNYETTNAVGEILTYKVTIDTGNISTENNKDVKITVNNVNITDGQTFKDNGYSVDNDLLRGLLDGNLKVIQTNGNKTTVTVNNTDNLIKDGNKLSYTAANGTTYNFTKVSDNQYSYTVTNGNTTTNYHVQVIPGNITATDHIPVKIDVSNGKIKDGVFTVTDNGKGYTIDNTNISTLLTDVLTVDKNSDGTATTLKFTDGVKITGTTTNADGTVTYNVTKGTTPYTFTKNLDGSYTYTDNTDASNVLVYNVTVDPGTLTYEVKVKADNMTKIDNVITSGGGYTVTSDNGNIISELMNGKLNVVESADGLHTTLTAKDSSALKQNGNNYTYTAGGKTYNFTRNNGVYQYKADNGVIYEVTLEQGDLDKTYNINIDVSDGVFYINEKGEGTLSLELPNGYKITKNADGSKFTDNFTVKYNDPVDQTQITGPAQTTVSVTNKATNETYKTTDISATDGVYNSLTKNSDGTYSISAVKDNITYNINIKSGLVVSDTTIPVKIDVKDGKLTDGVFSDNGYTVTNSDIDKLLKDKIEVVNKGGKTTVQFKDEIKNLITTNADGSRTYNDGTNTYTFMPNTDGTYTYSVTNPNGESIEYKVSIDTGNISTENNKDVTITVNNGTMTDGKFTGNGYTVDNDVLRGLLNGNLQVINTANNKTTVTVNNDSNLSKDANGNLTYLAADGKTYNFTKVSNDKYSYTVTEGNNTTHYNVQIVQGNITTTNNIPVTINVGDGKVNNGVVIVTDGGKGYTIDNPNISTLLTDVLTFDKNSDGTATTLKFTDGVTITSTTPNADGTVTYNVTKGTTPYTFTKNPDGSYTYTDNTDPANIKNYNVTIDPGTLTYEVKVKAGDMTTTDNEITSGGGYTVTSDNGSIIADLLNGKLNVIETADGLNTTLAAKNSTALTQNGNNYTYTADGGKQYKFTKAGNVYSYTADNGVKYEVTVEQGKLDKRYNINIDVTDGVFYINAEGTGNLSLNTPEGYTITKNANNSKFTDNFNIKYNEPLVTPGDTTQVTGPYKTTVSIANKNGNTYKTDDFDITSGGYNNITPNADGSYTISAIKDNITYNINIKPGQVVSDTRVPVTINVNNGKLTDDKFEGSGYTVTNNDIAILLQDKIEVVNKDGKTTVQFKDEVTKNIKDNGDGTRTYDDGTNKYTFTTNNDGTYTYNVTNPKGEEIDYVVKINNGDIATYNTVPVTISVDNGTITDGVFSGGGYTINDPTNQLKNLLGELSVTPTGDGNHTTINLPTGELLVLNGDGTYTYTYKGNDGVTTHYVISIDPGDISKFHNQDVSVDVGGGKIEKGTFTPEGYTIDNPTIRNLLDGVITVTTTDNTTTKLDFTDKSEGVFTDNGDGTFIYKKDGVNYPFAKTGDNKYTFSFKDDEGLTTNYTITIKPGTITNYLDKNVSLKVGDGTLRDGEFTGNGYTVDDDVIGGLLSGELDVNYNLFRMYTDVEFSNPDNVTKNGANYSYKKGGVTYAFKKNDDGTYNYVVKNGNTVTTYNVTIDTGKLTIEDTPKETPAVNNDPTPTTPSTPTNNSTPTTPSTPTNNSTSTTPSAPSSGGGGSSSTPTTTTTSMPTPIYTTSTPTTQTTQTTPSTPTYTTPSTPEPTITTPEPNETVETPPVEITETPEPTPLETPELTEITETPEPIETPEPTPLDTPEITGTVETPEPIETPLDMPELVETTETPEDVELGNPDYDLRSSSIEEFPEEKGDYIDLDSQDHILIETVDANAEILDIDVVPEEFDEANARNIVTRGQMELTPITSPTTTTNTENSTPANRTTSSTNAPTNNTNSNNVTSNNINSNNAANNVSRDSNQTSISTNNIVSGNGELTSINEQPATSRNENSNSGNGNVTETSDDSSTGLNLNGDLGAIESGRSDSSQEVNTSEQSSTQSTQGTQETQELSSTNQSTQETNSENQTSQESNSENEEDRDNDSEEK